MQESIALAKACRAGAVELLKRAKDILEEGGCGCAALESSVCASCYLQQVLQDDIDRMSGKDREERKISP